MADLHDSIEEESVDGARATEQSINESIPNVTEEPAEQTELLECTPCKYDGQSNEARSYCSECREYLCESCEKLHRRFRKTRNHELLSGSSMPSKLPSEKSEECTLLCACNQNNVELFCEDHHNLLCFRCVTVKHRKCNTVTIEHKSTSYTVDNLKATSEELYRLRDKLVKLQSDGESNRSILEDMEQECKQQIKQFRISLNTYLDAVEETTLLELNKWKQMQETDIETQFKFFTSTIEMADLDINLIQTSIAKGNKCDMYVANTKVIKSLADYKEHINEIAYEIYPPFLEFESSKKWSDIQKEIHQLGYIKTNYRNTEIKTESIANMEPEFKKGAKISTKPTLTSSSAFMPTGELVVCDRNNSNVKLFDQSFKDAGHISVADAPLELAVVNCNEVIVTVPDLKQLQYVIVLPEMKLGKHITLRKKCWGVAISAENIYVTLFDDLDNTTGLEIKVLNKVGKELKSIATGLIKLKVPIYLAVNQRADKIYLSDYGTSVVACMSIDGKLVNKYSDYYLKTPRGLYIDGENNILVCGQDSNNIQVVNADGKKLKTLLSFGEGMKPYSVAYRKRDKTLVVTFNEQKDMSVYQLK